MEAGVRIVETGAGSAAGNMALDWALLDLRGRGEIPDTIRIYAWREPAVSVGYSQDADRELDREACRALGVEIVHRPTGGALVLHGHDLTYSIVAGVPRTDRTLVGKRVAAALIVALGRMGVDARPGAGGGDARRRNRGACFESIAPHEITAGGRKIVGNARRWAGGAVLQHGSVSLRPSDRAIVDLMAGLDAAERDARRAAMSARATSVEEESGRAWTYEAAWPVFVDAFRGEFGGVFDRSGLGRAERGRAGVLEERVRRGEPRRRGRRTGRSGRPARISGAGN
jgi:lipoate-protein ligase A